MNRIRWTSKEVTCVIWYYFEYKDDITNIVNQNTKQMKALIKLFMKINKNRKDEQQTWNTIRLKINEINNYVSNNPGDSFKLKGTQKEKFDNYMNNQAKLKADYEKIYNEYIGKDENINNAIKKKTSEKWKVKRPVTITNEKWSLYYILENIDNGKCIVPLFQRDFVWNQNKTIEFLNSFFKRKLFGTLYLWENSLETIWNTDNPFFSKNKKNRWWKYKKMVYNWWTTKINNNLWS